MKKNLLFAPIITIAILIMVADLNSTTASATLPNDATAGAPADNSGATCTSCHAGTATQTTGVISSDIPVTGFAGGTIYNFTVTMSGAAAYGFEMTPQTTTSNVGLGTWIAGTGSSVSGKYIKQSAKKTGTSATWTFKWTAPSTATTVTFYGAFNYANNNNASSGDIIKKSSVTYFANTTEIKENSVSQDLLSVFPNPTIEILYVSSNGLFSKGEIYSLEGKLCKHISEQELITKTIEVKGLSPGTYYIHLSSNNGQIYSSRFIKN